MAKLTNTNLAITSDDERKTSHCVVTCKVVFTTFELNDMQAGLRMPAAKQLPVRHRQDEPADRHAWLAMLEIRPFVVPQPGDGDASLYDRELSAVPCRLHRAESELRRDQHRIQPRRARHHLVPQLRMTPEPRT